MWLVVQVTLVVLKIRYKPFCVSVRWLGRGLARRPRRPRYHSGCDKGGLVLDRGSVSWCWIVFRGMVTTGVVKRWNLSSS